MKSKLTPLMLALSVAGLTACGGSGSGSGSSAPEIITYTVNVSLGSNDGLVCADSNQNLMCDTGETQATSTAGNATLTSQNIALLNTNYILTQSDKFSLAAPSAIADNAAVVLSPATTAVVGQLMRGVARDEAVTKTNNALKTGLKLELNASELLTQAPQSLNDFSQSYLALWEQALTKSDNTVALLTGFTEQLQAIATASLENTHLDNVDEYVSNALYWDRGFPMTDTGVVTFAENDATGLTATVAAFPGQDADFGLDVTQSESSDGHAGFKYVKLDVQGNELAADASEWSCVKDQQTGLIWEKKLADDSVRSGTYLFINKPELEREYFYDEEEYVDELEYASCDNTEGKSDGICSAQQYVSHVNSLNDGAGLCGSTQWQLPSVNQLESLIHFGQAYSDDETVVGIDTAFFPNTFTEVYNYYQTDTNSLLNAAYDESKYNWTIGFSGSEVGTSDSMSYCTTGQDCYGGAEPVRLVVIGEKE